MLKIQQFFFEKFIFNLFLWQQLNNVIIVFAIYLFFSSFFDTSRFSKLHWELIFQIAISIYIGKGKLKNLKTNNHKLFPFPVKNNKHCLFLFLELLASLFLE